jgi:hypothetical protein
MKKSISLILKFVVFNFAIVFVSFLPITSNAGITIKDQSAGYQNDDNIANFRIAVPTKSMIRRADREIHLNMYNDVKSAYKMSFSVDLVEKGDELINNQFESTYHIVMNQEQALTADEIINDLFAVEQINYNSTKQINNGDLAITSLFSSAL